MSSGLRWHTVGYVEAKTPWWKFKRPESRVAKLEQQVAALEKRLEANNIVFTNDGFHTVVWSFAEGPAKKITVSDAIGAIMRHVGLRFAGGSGVRIEPTPKKKK